MLLFPNSALRPGRIIRPFAFLTCLVLSGLLLLAAGCQRTFGRPGGEVIPATAPSGRLQEVAPPAAVQQLQAALADRDPRLSVEGPHDGDTLPLGDWSLRLRIRNWPLVDAGPLGLGPHVVVQIDDQPPLRLTEHRSTPAADLVEVTLPPLAPGSHRITAYAALPWGEAVKNPGASARLRVQVVAGNPLTLPPPGTPELVAVSPSDGSHDEPVLLDWLLYDAPLQHLEEGDERWRLRVIVNGDAFLLDQNVPLWLTGWEPGTNALVMELLDGRGEPLNPPFNSLVRVVTLSGTGKPRWLAGALAPDELAVLLGDAPPPPIELPAYESQRPEEVSNQPNGSTVPPAPEEGAGLAPLMLEPPSLDSVAEDSQTTQPITLQLPEQTPLQSPVTPAEQRADQAAEPAAEPIPPQDEADPSPPPVSGP